MIETIISPLVIMLTLFTSSGMLLHETKVDKMASLSMFAPLSTTHFAAEETQGKLETTPHTHVERTSLNRASAELSGHIPTTTPRKDDKKYRLQKKVPRGFHVFDSYHVPISLIDNGQF